MANTLQDLADLIFPNVMTTVDDLERRYPPRDLSEGAMVTRFAPSPTGFLHTGSLFTALVAYFVAQSTGGVYFFRLEDTDQKREVAGTGNQLVDQLSWFGIEQDEGYTGEGRPEKGNYGPYIQSARGSIYDAVIKEMILKGRAYPCFCSREDLDQLRAVQEANRVVPGYYGNYARCRNLSNAERIRRIKAGEPFVIRFRSEGDPSRSFQVKDLVRGVLSLPENNQDIVIRKSDGLPTYHFAHLVDDHFMRTNCVTRGEEWLSSLPIHIELFKTMGWEAPSYAHLPVIMVTDADTGNRRKLSKRKDREAAVSYFIEQGYPREGIIRYLLTIANSNFEEWMRADPRADVLTFPFSFSKMSRDGALFDMPKLIDICQDYLAYVSAEKLAQDSKEWAQTYSPELLSFIEADPARYVSILNIERDQPKPRKDYARFSDIYPKVAFFDPSVYDAIEELPFDEKVSVEDRISILRGFEKYTGLDRDADTWFQTVKDLGASLGFAPNPKEFKQNPEAYRGVAGDVAAVIRVAVTGSRNSPSLYWVLKILGETEVRRRLESAISHLESR